MTPSSSTFVDCSAIESDPITERMALIANLKDNWDGPHSVGASSEALNVMWTALRDLPSELKSISGCSMHPDGYINIEWDDGFTFYVAEVWPDRIEYSIIDISQPSIDLAPKEWIGPLSAVELRAFIDENGVKSDT